MSVRSQFVPTVSSGLLAVALIAPTTQATEPQSKRHGRIPARVAENSPQIKHSRTGSIPQVEYLTSGVRMSWVDASQGPVELELRPLTWHVDGQAFSVRDTDPTPAPNGGIMYARVDSRDTWQLSGTALSGNLELPPYAANAAVLALTIEVDTDLELKGTLRGNRVRLGKGLDVFGEIFVPAPWYVAAIESETERQKVLRLFREETRGSAQGSVVRLGISQGVAPEMGPSTTPDWNGQANQPGAHYGAEVSTAGDVNGDGYSDWMVSAPGYRNPNGSVGRVFVYHGASDKLSDLPSWMAFPMDPAGLMVGCGSQFAPVGVPGISTAGDVNGDGYDDVIIAASGRALVFHGSSNGLRGESRERTTGNEENADSPPVGSEIPACRVAFAGDVNGDGFDDVLVAGGVSVRVCNGSAVGLTANCSDRGLLPSVPGVGSAKAVQQGFLRSLANAGDGNADGFSDILFSGLFDFPSPGTYSFSVAVAYGSPNGLEDALFLPYNTDTPQMSVSGIGDVNADGYADVAIHDFRIPGLKVHYGPDWVAGPDWQLLDPRELPGFVGVGFGDDISSAGDVNGDGIADLLVGGHNLPPAPFASGSGWASVYYGSSSGLDNDGTRPDGTPVSADWAVGNLLNGDLGRSVAAAGDVNGDGYGDIVVGAPSYSNPETDEGVALLYLGGPDVRETPIPSNPPVGGSVDVDPSDTAQLEADVNSDGRDDLILVTPAEVSVYLGSGIGYSETPVSVGLLGIEPDSDVYFINVEAALAGDVNADGYVDVLTLVARTFSSFRRDGTYVLWPGGKSGLGPPLWRLDLSAPFGSLRDLSAAPVGDWNADGFDDIVINQNETVDLLPGGPEGLGFPIWSARESDGRLATSDCRLTAIDLNGDGSLDLRRTVFDSLCGVHMLDRRRTYVDAAQLDVASGSAIPLGGQTEVAALEITGRATSPSGRARVRLEWQAIRQGEPIDEATVQCDGAPCREAESVQTPVPDSTASAMVLSAVIDQEGRNGSLRPLEAGRLYDWRARFATDWPLSPRSPWYSLAAPTEDSPRFKVAGEAPPRPFELIGPEMNRLYQPGTDAPRFAWFSGQEDTSYRIEWSNTDQFAQVIAEPLVITRSPSGVNVYIPDNTLWLQVLRAFARSPDLRAVPLFWRVVPDDLGTLDEVPRGVLLIARPNKPMLISPASEATVFTVNEPIEFSWDPNENASFMLRFSSTEWLEDPCRSGEGFDITAASQNVEVVSADAWSWTPSNDLWNPGSAHAPCSLRDLALRSGGRVYWSVFARDALGRVTWSEPRLLILPTAGWVF